MKNFILVILLVFCSNAKTQEKIILNLNVFNEYTKELVPFADVRIVNTTTNQKLTKRTNYNGNVKIDLYPDMKYKLIVSSASDSSLFIFEEKTLDFNTQGLPLGLVIEYEAKLWPVFQKEGLHLIKDIYFGVYSFKLDDQSKMILDNLVTVMIENPDVVLEVGGFASCNLSLYDANTVSVERARVVFTYLISKGVNYKRIKAVAWGKEKNISQCTCEQISSNELPCTEKDFLLNSRVDLNFNL